MASTLLTAGIILGVTFLFIFLFSLLHKRGKQKNIENQRASFANLVAANNLTIHEKEQFGHYMIAIDTLQRKLCYLNFSGNKEEVKVIDLQKTKETRVVIEENSIYENKKGKTVFVEKHVIQLHLEITSKMINESKELLVFYTYHDGIVDYNRLKNRIEYWRDNINQFTKGQ